MSYITSQRKADLESDLTATLLHIAAIDTAMTSAGSTAAVKSYSFDSGTGRQQETFTSFIELAKTRKSLAASRDLIRRLLGGTAIVRSQLRR